MHVENGERGKDRECDDFLQDLQLGQAQRCIAKAVGGDLKQILEERDAPTEERSDVPFLVVPVSQVRIPGEGHERVGDDEKNRGAEQDGRFHTASIAPSRQSAAATGRKIARKDSPRYSGGLAW
jgi:hypothetical protein